MELFRRRIAMFASAWTAVMGVHNCSADVLRSAECGGNDVIKGGSEDRFAVVGASDVVGEMKDVGEIEVGDRGDIGEGSLSCSMVL